MTRTKPVYVLLFLLITGTIIACKEDYTPKARGYHRIDFPEKEYKVYHSDCPFTFEYPVYGKISKDSSRLSEPCWLNIVFPGYDGKLHLSYKNINNNLSNYIEDSRTLAYKHTIKAEAIDEKIYQDKNRNVYGILYNIKGNVASSAQFFITDSTNHFIRGALYFETYPNKDSLAPVINFFKKDVIHLIETIKWKK